MNGRPVWLASASLHDFFGRIIPSARWSAGDRWKLESTLLEVLAGVGDSSRERFFRMPVTACIHRQLTAAEEAGLRPEWHQAPAVHMAGGPMEILRETIPGALSTRPCVRPGQRNVPAARDADVFLLVDCGHCDPCRARAAIEDAP